MTIQVSEFSNKHLPAIVRLLNEEYRGSFEFIAADEERMLKQIRRRDLKILVAEERGNVLGFVATHLEERGEVDITWLAVQQDLDRLTIENALVTEVEKNVKGDTVSATIDEGSTRINDWVNRGYILNPGWLRMSAKLDGAKPVPNIAEGFTFRNLKLGEERKLNEAVNTVFGWQRLKLGDIETWKLEDPPFDEDWVQIAEVKERFVSAVVARPDTDYNYYLHLKRGNLGPAATLPEFRNKHLASALTARAMNLLFEKGLTSVRLGTSEMNVSSRTLLRSLGFHVDNVRKVLRKNLARAGMSDNHAS